MLENRRPLFSLFGFKVSVDASWLILAVLVTWTLAQGVFPAGYPGLGSGAYLIMGIVGALGLFVSIVLHEFAHSLVARHYGMPMRGITLFIFGGIAEMEDEPPTPKIEGFVAIAGPIASYVLAGLFIWFEHMGNATGLPASVTGVLWYLGTINFIVATFNLIPGFPLDGGRILRAVLWAWKKDLRAATRIASSVGSAFAFLLIALGILNLFSGYLIGGIWQVILGMFLLNISKSHYDQVIVREMLKGKPVRYFMESGAVTVPPALPVSSFIDDYVYRYHFQLFPVTEAGRLVGCISVDKIRTMPQEERNKASVRDVMEDCSLENTVAPGTEIEKALRLMQKTGNSRLIVVDRGQVAGILVLRDLLEYIALKQQLEPQGHPA